MGRLGFERGTFTRPRAKSNSRNDTDTTDSLRSALYLSCALLSSDLTMRSLLHNDDRKHKTAFWAEPYPP